MSPKICFAAVALAAITASAGHAQGARDAAAAPPVPGAAPYDPADPWLWGDVATLRGLDKVTAETRDFLAPVGEDVPFFALTISIKRCAKRPPEHSPPETIVGMEVYDRRTDGAGAEERSERIFSGWMFGSSPALNPLEHPVYDVWVLDCVNSRAEPVETVTAEDRPARRRPTVQGPAPGEVLD
jgi:hypothetical protein